MQEQPTPIKNELPCIQDLVIKDIQNRKEVGIKKYNSVLQAYNGRSAVRDAYEEAHDLTLYLKQVLEEEQKYNQHEQLLLNRGWLAGILDGEGCLSVGIAKTGFVHMSLIIINTDKAMLEKVIEITGCGKIYQKKARINRKATYHWRVGEEEGTQLLRPIIDVLTTKKPQAILWLQLHEYRKRRKFSEVTTAEEKAIALEIKKLKHEPLNMEVEPGYGHGV